jgi:hypothetical protein
MIWKELIWKYLNFPFAIFSKDIERKLFRLNGIATMLILLLEGDRAFASYGSTKTKLHLS